MATYVIGDVQGCFATLEALLARIGFVAGRDDLVLAGDLVNRGPRSAEVLRWVMRAGGAAMAVLGNHDLHLLARHFGVARPKKRDTLDDVLGAPDREAMIDWLRAQPLAWRRGEYLVTHAGLLPQWSAADAVRLAEETSAALRGPDPHELLARLRERPARRWEESLGGTERLRVIVQALTQLRTCLPDGTPDLDYSGPPAQAPPGQVPWFDDPWRVEREVTVVAGHWATLGLHVGPRAVSLDTGAGWGQALSALRLEDRAVIAQPTLDPVAGRGDA